MPSELPAAPSQFLVLPEAVRPSSLSQLTAAEVIVAIADAPLAMFVTEELRIVAINRRAQPAFAQDPQVIGKLWPVFLREYWAPEAAAEVTRIVERTLQTGTPFSSIGFAAPRAAERREERYDWEVHRIVTADQKRMLACYFAGPT